MQSTYVRRHFFCDACNHREYFEPLDSSIKSTTLWLNVTSNMRLRARSGDELALSWAKKIRQKHKIYRHAIKAKAAKGDKEAQAFLEKECEARRVQYATTKKQAAEGNTEARLILKKKKANEHRNFEIRKEAQWIKNTSAREAKATERLEVVRAQYAAISEQAAVANGEARLRNNKRITDQQRSFKTEQTTPQPRGEEDISAGNSKAPKSDKTGQPSSEKRAEGQGVSQYNVKRRQAAEGDEEARSWIKQRNIQQAKSERARNAATRKLVAEGNEGARLQVKQRKLKKAEGSRARYAATKNRAVEGGKEARSWLERRRINNQLSSLSIQVVDVVHERSMYRTKVKRLMRQRLQVPLEEVNISELASKSPESLIAIAESSRVKIDRDRYQQWLLQIRDISILCLLSIFDLQLWLRGIDGDRSRQRAMPSILSLLEEADSILRAAGVKEANWSLMEASKVLRDKRKKLKIIGCP